MEQLTPDRLIELWNEVEAGRLDYEGFERQEEQVLAGLAARWSEALMLPGCTDLLESLVREYGAYAGIEDVARVRELFVHADRQLNELWRQTVKADDPASIEAFYEGADVQMPQLLYWHSLRPDDDPLAYVVALEFAEARGCSTCLDFGAGPGSGALLFARNGFEVALADISASALRLSEWRFRHRGLSAPLTVDLRTSALPAERFDFVTAMDVFEHLVDPVAAVEPIWRSLRPGGLLYGRFHCHLNEAKPEHIVADWKPTRRRMEELGLVKIWEDEWLWGHLVFEKR